MTDRLTLKARYRNANAQRLSFGKLTPALRCMALIEEYRDLRFVAANSDDDWAVSVAESSMEQLDREFASARADLRRSFDAVKLERIAEGIFA